jgi:hypothetical protein
MAPARQLGGGAAELGGGAAELGGAAAELGGGVASRQRTPAAVLKQSSLATSAYIRRCASAAASAEHRAERGRCGNCARHRGTPSLATQPPWRPRRTPQSQSQTRDETRRDETRRDETRRDETRRDETRRDETRPDETRRDETRRDQTRRDETRRGDPVTGLRGERDLDLLERAGRGSAPGECPPRRRKGLRSPPVSRAVTAAPRLRTGHRAGTSSVRGQMSALVASEDCLSTRPGGDLGPDGAEPPILPKQRPAACERPARDRG